VSRPDFGCATCWPEAAEAAWTAQTRLSTEHQLVDESHFRVTLRRCVTCSQVFLKIFTESVDFTHGEDPQYWTIIPLTAEEATGLIEAPEPPSEAALGAIGPGRRSLRRDYPSGGSLTCAWNTGVGLLVHD
jgi:hypothetical protein